MEREEFIDRMNTIKNSSTQMSEDSIRKVIHSKADFKSDLPICIGELSELIVELAKYQRDKMDRNDFLQKLSHVQCAVWTLQDHFGISDEEIRMAIRA